METIKGVDRELIASLRERGVLVPVEGHRLDLGRGVIMVTCPDCDQRADLFNHQEAVFREQGLDPRIHALGLNGGALLVAEESPLNDELGEDRVLIAHMKGARQLKGINTVALYSHIPCGAAGLANLSSEEVVDFLVLGKRRVRAEIPEAKVACFLHVDKGEGNKRTYFVSYEAWRTWHDERKPNYPAIGRRRPAPAPVSSPAP